MQQPQFHDFRGGRRRVQSALQLLFSRVQSSVNNSTSVTGRGIRDLEQIALRGPPFIADDLVSLLPLPHIIIHASPARRVAGGRRRYRQPPWHNQRQRVSCKFFIMLYSLN